MKTGWTWRTLSLLVCDMVTALTKNSTVIKFTMPTLFWRVPAIASEKKIQWTNSSWIEVVAGIKAKVLTTYS
jgi:hypothetical protein